MTQCREILQLHSMNLSQTNIAASCGALLLDPDR